jgi:hypothetical protein
LIEGISRRELLFICGFLVRLFQKFLNQSLVETLREEIGLAFKFPFKDILPDLNISIEGSLDYICFFNFGVSIEDGSRFLLLLILIDDALTGGVKLLHVFAEHGEAVEDDAGVLVLGVIDEGEDEVDALAHAGDQLPTGL